MRNSFKGMIIVNYEAHVKQITVLVGTYVCTKERIYKLFLKATYVKEHWDPSMNRQC